MTPNPPPREVTVERRHREAAVLAYQPDANAEWLIWRWVESGAVPMVKERWFGFERVSRVAQALAAAESSARPAAEWVRCSERMPEPTGDETVLMYFATTEVLTGAWDGDDWIHGDTIIPRRHVTHWMPLPPSPPEGT